VDGYARVRDKTTGDEDKVDFNAPLPMLYANFRVDLPLTGLHLDAEGSGISYSGNRMLDLKAGVGYDFAFGLGVEAGYWRQSLKIDDIEDVSTDLDIGGPYLGAYLDF
jgi:outer membrane protein